MIDTCEGYCFALISRFDAYLHRIMGLLRKRRRLTIDLHNPLQRKGSTYQTIVFVLATRVQMSKGKQSMRRAVHSRRFLADVLHQL